MRRFFLVTFLLGVGLANPVSGLELRVRGQAKFDATFLAAGTVAQVAGTLTDEKGRPIAHREVEVRIEGVNSPTEVTRKVSTNSRGQFVVQEELPPGPYTVILVRETDTQFEGDRRLETIRLQPEPFNATVVGPETVFGRDQPVIVYGRASTGTVPVQLPADLYLEGARLGAMELDGTGRGSFDVAQVLSPGINRIEFVIPGSAFRDEVRAYTELRFTEDVNVEARLEERVSRLSRGLSFVGRVSDVLGPIPNTRIQAIFLPAEPTEGLKAVNVTTRTDNEGRFEAFASGLRLGEGTWKGVVRVVPAVGKTVEVDVQPFALGVSQARRLSGWLGVIAIILGLGFFFQRSFGRVRQAWLEWTQSRARRVRDRQALDVHETIVPVFLEPTDETPASRDDVGGVVWDIWRNRPATGCEIVLVRGERRSEPVQCDERGRFRMVDVEAGEWELSVIGRGFVRGVMRIRVPHSGRYAAMRIDMVAVPLKIRKLYQTTIESALGEDMWGRLSPAETDHAIRELLRVLDSRDLSEDLLQKLESVEATEMDLPDVLDVIAQLIEESYYSGRIYEESVWLQAREIVLRLRRAAGIEGVV